MSYHVSNEAYCKLLLHVVKYPHRTVNGILIGEKENSGRSNITDAIPLFHNLIGVTAMLEVAFAQIEAYCRQVNKQIIGYYQANELFTNNGLTLFSAGVGQKILENCSDACVIMVSNENCIPTPGDDPTAPFKLFVSSDSRGWKEAGSHKLTVDEGAVEKFHQALGNNLETKLVDFDNYLDKPVSDWLNRQLFTSTSPTKSPQRAKAQ